MATKASPKKPAAKGKSGARKSDVDNMRSAVIDPIYERYVKSVLRALGSTDFYEFFMTSVARAENEIQFSNRREEKYVDIVWVDAIEAVLGAFQNIASSPRNVIREEELIVNVANAKKGGSDVVRHLAMHASLVQNYDEEKNEVRPDRLMQKLREDTVGIYENRVVFTALERAYQFVKLRYDALFQHMGDEFGAKLKVRTDMQSATERVHMDMFLHITDVDGALDIDEKNRDIFDRIARIYRVLYMLMNSPFAQSLAAFSRVTGKITKTNILKRNPDYAKIVRLWEFLTHYDDVGYAIKIVEQNPVIDEAFERDIFHNVLFNYLVLKGHLERDKDRALPAPLKEKRRALKPKFIKQIIEELTEDYDLPDVEIRKVLIEELTREQLMQEEEAERRRLVEEKEQRDREEAERLRLEEEEAAERRRQEEELRAAEENLRRIEREQEERRRSTLFSKEAERFAASLAERLAMREELREAENAPCEDFSEVALRIEEAERREREEREAALRLEAEEKERLRREEEKERERLRAEEAARQAEILREELLQVAPLTNTANAFFAALPTRLQLRRDAEAARKEREEERLRRAAARR